MSEGSVEKINTTLKHLRSLQTTKQGLSIFGFLDFASRSLALDTTLVEYFFELAPIIVLVLNDQGQIVCFNHFMEKLGGRRLSQVERRDFFMEFIPLRERQRVRRAFRRFLKTGKRGVLAGPIIAKDHREVAIEWKCQALAAGKMDFLLAIGHDVSEKKQARRFKREKHLAEAKNRAKSSFLANMSHELRTPLNAIIGFSELLATSLQELTEKQQKDFSQKIAKAGRHLLGLIDDLLSFSMIEIGKVKLCTSKVNINHLAKTSIDFHRLEAEQKKISLFFTSTDEELLIWGDENRLMQIFNNLITNAIKYTPDGGEVGINISKVGENAKINVWDTGIGIHKKQHLDIFRAFEQVNETFTKNSRGVGLGLAITYKLVKMHQGHIWVESEPGCGSHFFVTLPASTLGLISVSPPETHY